MTRGLMKTTSSLAVAAAAGLFATSAMAADLGGNCCADLEERVAELEATTARKGNRKVSLTVYGQVNKALLWHDSDEADAYRSDKVTVRDNSANMSRFGFRGEAQIRPDLTAGYVIEIGLGGEDFGTTSDDAFLIRHNYVYLDSARLGRLTLGQTSQVTDGLYEINLANTAKVMGVLNEESGFLGDAFGTTFADALDGGRKQGIYYRTPSLAGFMLSTGYSHDTQGTDATDATDYWEVALKYAGEFNGVRLAAGIGYRQADNDITGIKDQVWLGSGSVMHMPTGLFLSGGYADLDSDDLNKRRDAFWLMAGIERNFFGYGNTTIFGEYGEINFDNEQAGADFAFFGGWSSNPTEDRLSGSFWGLGIVQSIDAAAVDLYLNFRRYELDGVTTDYPHWSWQDGWHDDPVKANSRDASVLTAGMIIKF